MTSSRVAALWSSPTPPAAYAQSGSPDSRAVWPVARLPAPIATDSTSAISSSRLNGLDSPTLTADGRVTRSRISAWVTWAPFTPFASPPRHVRRDLGEHPHRGARGGDEVHATGAEHVGDAHRVGEHGRRPAGHDEAGDLAGHEHRVLGVEVGVDERRGDEEAGRVDVARRAEAAGFDHGSDVPPVDEHVHGSGLGSVHVDHMSTADRHVGHLLAGGHAP